MGCNAVTERLPSLCMALGSIPSTDSCSHMSETLYYSCRLHLVIATSASCCWILMLR